MCGYHLFCWYIPFYSSRYILYVFSLYTSTSSYMSHAFEESRTFHSWRMLWTYILVAVSKINIQGVTWCLVNIQENNFWDYFVKTVHVNMCPNMLNFWNIEWNIFANKNQIFHTRTFHQRTTFFEKKTIRFYICS